MIPWAIYSVGVVLTLIGICISSIWFIVPGVAGLAAGVVLMYRRMRIQKLTGRKRKIQVLISAGSVLFFLCFPGFLAVEKGSPLVTLFFYGAVTGLVLYAAALCVYVAGRIVRHKIEAIIMKVADIEKHETDKAGRTGGKVRVLFRMEASGSLAEALIVNLGVMIIAAGLLFLLLLVRTIFTLGLFIAGIVVIALYLMIDRLVWERSGIRAVEVDPDGINFYRGRERIIVRVEAGQITGINVFRKLNRKVVNIMLGGSASRVMPGVTMFSGPRIRVTNDLFNDREFDEFIERLKAFMPAAR
jgi:hypothetical protein